jgi:hypothetical protein
MTVDSESDEMKGSWKPGVTNLRFQLDAAKAGELLRCAPYRWVLQLTLLPSPE